APSTTEIVPEGARIVTLDGERRCAGETVVSEERCGDPDVRTPAGAVLHHRRGIARTQDLSARAEVLGDAQRLADPRGIEHEEARGDRGAAQRIPGAGTVVVGY